MKNFFRKYISKFSKYSKIYENSFDLLNIINFYNIDVVLDVGASWGSYAKTLRRFGYKKRIISFEPVDKTHSKLLQNSMKDAEWQVHKKVIISNKNIKKLSINVSKDFDNSSVLNLSKLHKENHKNSQYTHKEEVECDTLDNLINHYPLSKNLMLKIDVQGNEMDVLKSAINNLSKFKLIQIELSLQTLYEGQALYKEILNFMNEHNYDIWNIFPGYKKLNGQLFQFDAVFYNKNNYKY